MAMEAPTLTALLKKDAAADAPAYPSGLVAVAEPELTHAALDVLAVLGHVAAASLPETLGKLPAVFGAPVLEEKLSPVEADAVLLEYPATKQAVPFGAPHDKYGEEVFGAKKTSPATGVGQNDGGFTEQLRQGLPVLGLSVASMAATGLAAGAATPATGLGLFAMLIVGLSTVTIRVLRA